MAGASEVSAQVVEVLLHIRHPLGQDACASPAQQCSRRDAGALGPAAALKWLAFCLAQCAQTTPPAVAATPLTPRVQWDRVVLGEVTVLLAARGH
jgi:hypothetical protein